MTPSIHTDIPLRILSLAVVADKELKQNKQRLDEWYTNETKPALHLIQSAWIYVSQLPLQIWLKLRNAISANVNNRGLHLYFNMQQYLPTSPKCWRGIIHETEAEGLPEVG